MTANELKFVNKLRENYQSEGKEISKFEKLKNLNRQVNRPAEIFAYVFGVIGTLILGTGMCLVMPEVIGGMMGIGIAVGILGIILVSLTYPIYKRILMGRRIKYSERIIKLSNELLNENN